MAEQKTAENKLAYIPNDSDQKAIRKVLDAFTTARNTVQKSYQQFNGRTLYDCIDDWTKRWNSWIPPESVLDETAKSRIFLSFTRKAIISYLATVAVNPPKAHITAVNKNTKTGNKVFARFLEDLKESSERNENYESKFLEFSLELTTKGTGIMYEGYLREEQDTKIPEEFDPVTGEITYKKGTRTIFDDCCARVIPLEDFYITNPYLSVRKMQQQPKIIWKEVTQFNEAEREYGHYKKFKYVNPGSYTVAPEPTTFYRNKLQSEVGKDQVEILRYYCRSKNEHIVMINGVIIYDGPIPFKDGKYPFAGAVFEPFGNDFFWGAGYPHKIMGDQDMINTSWNLMVDKTYASLLPFGLSSDLDDLIDDEILQPNRIRKVNDISKWQFSTLPGVTAGEQNMLQMALSMARENSLTEAGGNQSTPKGGKLPARQLMLKQQEVIKNLGFSGAFSEDYEKDRTELRLSHILQFYSIPKIEKITGKGKKEQEQMTFRDIQLTNVPLSDGKQGNKVIKIIGEDLTDDSRTKIADQLSETEVAGEINGTPTEAIAIHIDTFNDFNWSVEIEKNSAFQRNQILDQAQRQDYAQWRMAMSQMGAPVDTKALVEWVDEAYDAPDFTPEQPQGQPGQQPGQPQTPQQNQNNPMQKTPQQQLSPLTAMMQ